MDELLQQIERLAHANQALTQRLDREHSMRLAAESDAAALGRPVEDQWFDAEGDLRMVPAMHEGFVDLAIDGFFAVVRFVEMRDLRHRANEAEAALEALRADVERDQTDIPRYRERIAVASVCELLAAWGRAQDVEHCRENRRRAVHFHRSADEAIKRASDALYGRR